ncbi:hypothetical protein WJX73_006584 [Symbiochloris irregularis]|uniref:Uncharacterized protein n=1 Tax=Symbiochloris irregularis TaxID=706552 RepID=A0AAW1NT31_9CHLO
MGKDSAVQEWLKQGASGMLPRIRVSVFKTVLLAYIWEECLSISQKVVSPQVIRANKSSKPAHKKPRSPSEQHTVLEEPTDCQVVQLPDMDDC